MGHFLKVVFTIWAFGTIAHAKPVIEFMGCNFSPYPQTSERSGVDPRLWDAAAFPAAGDLLSNVSAARTCRDISDVRDRLFISTLVVGVVGIVGGVCSGPVGAGVAALAAFSALGIQSLDYQISRIPCKEGDDEEKIRRLVSRLVCEELTRAGHVCDPETVEVEKDVLKGDGI